MTKATGSGVVAATVLAMVIALLAPVVPAAAVEGAVVDLSVEGLDELVADQPGRVTVTARVDDAGDLNPHTPLRIDAALSVDGVPLAGQEVIVTAPGGQRGSSATGSDGRVTLPPAGQPGMSLAATPGLTDGTGAAFTMDLLVPAGTYAMDLQLVTGSPVERLAGADRIATAAAVSRLVDGPVDRVLVARADAFPDALAGGPGAALLGAPIVLVNADAVPEIAAVELARLQPRQIVVLGGVGAITEQVADQLRAFASDPAEPVQRLGGSNRFETAAAIATALFPAPVDVLYLATGSDFPDALAGAAAAGHVGAPVLLTSPDALPPSTQQALQLLQPRRIVVLGGGAVITPAVEAALRDLQAGWPAADRSVERVAGPERYATAVAISQATFAAPVGEVFIATGLNFPDALAAAAVAGARGAPLLLVPGDSVPDLVQQELARLSPQRIFIIGGDAVVSEAVASQLIGFVPADGPQPVGAPLRVTEVVEADGDTSFAYRFNAGGAAYTDEAGRLWLADPLPVGDTGTYTLDPPRPIAGTDDDVLYQTERFGSDFTYPVQIPGPGVYAADLHFAEIFHGVQQGTAPAGPGNRVFDVEVEGETVLEQYDPTAEAGAVLTADVQSVEVEITDPFDETLDIRVLARDGSVDMPKISAVEVRLVRPAEGPDTTAPEAPEGLTATAGDGEVALQWDAVDADDLAAYRLYRSTGSTVATTAANLVAEQTGTSYVDADVSNGTTYRYVVTAVDRDGNESDRSRLAAATPREAVTPPPPPPPTDTTPPDAPQDLVAAAGDGEVSLAWEAVEDEDPVTYQVRRSTSTPVSTSQAPLAEVTDPAYTDTAAVNGTTYFYVVTATDPADNQSGASNQVSATPQAPADTTPPAAPTGLTATPGDDQVQLGWNAVSAADLDGYRVYRATTPDVATTPANLLASPAASTYTDTTAVNGTEYFYVVTAVDEAGNASTTSNEASATPADTTPPAAPTGLTATPGDGQVTLTWAAVTDDDAVTYAVYRSTTSPVDTTQPPLAEVTDPTHTDTTTVNGTDYVYVVTAVDPAGNESAASNEAAATPGDTTPPAAPTGLTATPGDDQVQLGWNAVSASDLDGYRVYRATTPDVATTPANLLASPAASTYTDTTAVNGTEYFYVVTAVDEAGNASTTSNEASATPADTTPPAAPTGLTATPGDGQVTLTWAAVTDDDAVTYAVYRSTTSPVDTTQPPLAEVTDPTYTDTTTVNGTEYVYVVTAVDPAGNESGASNEAAATPGDTTPPAAPTGLTATAGDDQVTLDWTDVADADLDGYRVYRSTTSPVDAIPANLLASPAASTYTDTTAVNGTEYVYVVTAVDEAGNASTTSNEASATPADTTPPAAPTGLTATPGDGQVTLTWAAVTDDDAVTYAVYRSTTSPVDTTQPPLAEVTDPTHTDTTTVNGTEYVYVVTAVDPAGNESAASNEASATPADTTPPAAPTGLTATPGDGQVQLSWTAITDEDPISYRVHRSTTSPVDTTQPPLAVTGSAAYTDTTAVNGTQYVYVITAIDPAGNASASSNEATATPEAPVAAPTAVDDDAATNGLEAVAIDVLANDSGEVALDPASVTIVDAPTAGTATTDPATGVITYTPGDSFPALGSDTFTYTVQDADARVSEPATVTVTDLRLVDLEDRFNAGGASYTDTVGRLWGPDRPTPFSTAFPDPPSDVPIAGTEDDLLYQTERFGSDFTYSIDVPSSGSYLLNLHFAEIFYGVEPGAGDAQRLFDVLVEGQPFLTSYDITAAAGGPATAVIETTAVQVADGQLDIRFVGIAGEGLDGAAKISAIEVLAYDTAAPAAPTLTADAGDGEVALTWTAVPDATSYQLYRSTTAGVQGDPLGAPVTGTSHLDTGLANGTTYHYTLTATDDAGNTSDPSAQVAATPAPPDTTPPAAPTGLTATAGEGQVTLAWQPVTDADSYRIYRSPSADVSAEPADLLTTVTTTSHVDAAVTNGTEYFYLVTAVDAADNASEASNRASATPTATGTVETLGTATVTIDSGDNLEGSTYNPGSFVISNTGEVAIESVSLDLSTAILADLVFDPDGTAGDETAKCLEVNGEGGTGYVTPADPCQDPFSQLHNPDRVADGYDVATVSFTGFGTGETFTFSADVDPTSIQGALGSGEAGSVSGLELTGSTITVTFADGSSVGQTFRTPGLDGTSTVQLGPIPADAPTIDVAGITLEATELSPAHQAAAVTDPQQTITVSGTPGADVRLLQIDGSRVQMPGYDVSQYEANTASAVTEYTATIGAGGTVDIPVTLTDTLALDSPDASGLNHFAAVEVDGSATGLMSDVVILDLGGDGGQGPTPPTAVDDVAQTTGSQGVTIDVLANDVSEAGLDPSTVVVTGGPSGGSTATPDPTTGAIQYTPEELYQTTGQDSFTYTVQDVNGQVSSPGTVTILDPEQFAFEYRFNAGGNAYADSSGRLWEADPGTAASDVYPGTPLDVQVQGTADDTLYQTERYGADFVYSLDVPEAATYTVNLHFAEIYYGVSPQTSSTDVTGQRIFDVIIEGQTVLDDYDIALEAGGAATAVIESVDAEVTDGALDIRFVDVTDDQDPYAKVAAIEVVAFAPTSPDELGATPATLDLGTVGLGFTGTGEVQLRNLGGFGDPSITLQAATVAGDDGFDVDLTPVTLAPGESTTAFVTFQPQVEGPAQAVITVPHSGIDAPLQIPVSASATAEVPVGFVGSALSNEQSDNPTSLEFGPDGRLYVAQQNGLIRAYTIERIGATDYRVTDVELIELVQDIPNHNDDGSPAPTETTRQVTGLMTAGTAAQPVLYVTSSDPRIAGGEGGADSGLDTNSGIVSRLTLVDGAWDHVQLVRGLPRSEENHSTNGLDLSADGSTLYVASGGNTNKGGPSNNFSGTPEYALSAAILSIDLTALDQLPVQVDGNGNQYVYDLPTLDDPQRDDAATDPFGGNNGLNQARWVVGGPVQVHSGGYRNPYDVVVSEAGRLYTWDNGPNTGWGGVPTNEGPQGTCTNEFNEASSEGYGDGLHHITAPGYYGGHPTPVRGNADSRAIVYEKLDGVWTATYDEPWSAFPEPPVDPSLIDPVECDYRIPGAESGAQALIGASTNGLVEYTATNFNGAITGDLLTASFNGKVSRTPMDDQGDAAGTPVAELEGLVIPLDVTAQGDDDVFPGSIWVVDYADGSIRVYEPADFSSCSGADDPDLDEDADGYTNADEIAAGTNPCSGGSVPPDADGDGISDRTDPDDDDDGVPDVSDAFAIEAANGLTTDVPVLRPFSQDVPGFGFFGLGLTGLMTDGATDYLDQYDPEVMAAGGAVGLLGVEEITRGDAVGSTNDQDNGFQFGVDAAGASGPFVVHTQVESPFFQSGGTAQAPQPGQWVGMQMGTGSQSDFLRLAIGNDSSGTVVQVLLEQGDVPQVVTTQTVPGLLSASGVDLYLEVDPATGAVQPRVSLDDGGTLIDIGGPVTVPTAWLTTADQALAVGVIATAGPTAPLFGAIWDFLDVQLAG